VDRAVAELAARQHGVVGRAQLEALGLSGRMIFRRLERGALHPVHRGVYAVGHASLTSRGRLLAAVLCGGRGSVLSHRSAARLWNLRPWRGRVEVTAPRSVERRDGLVFHRSTLPADEVTTRDGIPVTTVARTLLDLAACVPAAELERAAAAAEARRLADHASLGALVERYPGRRGIRAARWLVGEAGASGETKSALEERFLRLLDRAGLQRPRLNATLEAGGRLMEVDCLWADRRLVVELDGRAFHESRVGFDRDRDRDRVLAAAGWTVIRVTWRSLDRDRRAVVADLRTLLAR
jgi:very-short-patch-repair endonuclease